MQVTDTTTPQLLFSDERLGEILLRTTDLTEEQLADLAESTLKLLAGIGPER